MSTEDQGRSSYLDLLVTTLMEHEKNMDRLLDKLERVSKNFAVALEHVGPKSERPGSKDETPPDKTESGDLVYMRVPLSRSIQEVLEILDSLKK